MLTEFNDFLNITRKASVQEKLEGLCDIVEVMINLILKVPDYVDAMSLDINNKITEINNKINVVENKITVLNTVPKNVEPIKGNKIYTVKPPKVDLRSSIMSELQELFKKRRSPQQ